jgi:hypothetical protein
MRFLPFLFLIKNIIGFPCLNNISYSPFPKCPDEQNTPDCYYLQENLYQVCNSVFSREPINADNCAIFLNSCLYYNSTVLTPNLFCCELNTECNQQSNNLNNIPSECEDDPEFYDNIINSETQLEPSQTQIIFDNLANKPPQDINNVIRQAGILTLNSQPPFQLYQTQTNNFTFIAQQLQPDDNHNFQINNFNLVIPPLTTHNIAVSIIVWNTNPYLTLSNTTIDTHIISVSLSNLNSSLLNYTFTNPIQLKWNRQNVNNSLNYSLQKEESYKTQLKNDSIFKKRIQSYNK